MNDILNKLRQIKQRFSSLMPNTFVRRSIILLIGLELSSAVMVLCVWALKSGSISIPVEAVEAMLEISLALIGFALLILYMSLIVIIPVVVIVNFTRKGMKNDKDMEPKVRSALVATVILGMNWPLFRWLFVLIDRYSILGAD